MRDIDSAEGQHMHSFTALFYLICMICYWPRRLLSRRAHRTPNVATAASSLFLLRTLSYPSHLTEAGILSLRENSSEYGVAQGLTIK